MIHTLPNGFVAVTVPEGAYDFRQLAVNRLAYLQPNDKASARKIYSTTDKLPEGDWQFIGLASEVKEETAAGIVDKGKEMGYVDYRGMQGRKFKSELLNAAFDKSGPFGHISFTPIVLTALESFRSLLASLSLTPSTTVILKKQS